MAYIRGVNRKQIILFPEAVDDYITEDNPVQFIDAFVDNLDLKKLEFKHSEPESTGRPHKSQECKSCQFKPKCTRNKNVRIIYRWEYEEILEQMRERVKSNWDKVKNDNGYQNIPLVQ